MQEFLAKSGLLFCSFLDMPSLEELSTPVLKRKAPIKAVLLNQNGPLCGLGNWLVDEILFQAAIHPAQRSNTLTTSQLLALHTQIRTVVDTAVSVNADHKLFPKTWLFMHRWGKGRRAEPRTFELPDGSMATIVHQTVGGRTSAIVESVQKLLGEPASDDEVVTNMQENDDEMEKKPVKKASRKATHALSKAKTGRKRSATSQSVNGPDEGEESDLTPLEVSEAEGKPVKSRPKARKEAKKANSEVGLDAGGDTKPKKARKSRAKKAVFSSLQQPDVPLKKENATSN